MKIIQGLNQGTPEWHEYRRQHIGASDSSALMGINPFRTPLSLWEEKVLGWEPLVNDKMRAGTCGEEEARACYEKIMGYEVFPLVAECEKHPFLSASFDGVTKDLSKAVEIKCGASSHKHAKKGVVPDYYIAQMQHQMYIADLEWIHYFSYYKGESVLLTQERDDNFIKNMIEKQIQFWYHVQAETSPKD